MDEFSNTVRTGSREVADQVRPAPADAVRARGERLRNKRAVGSTVLVAAGVAIIGSTAFAVFGGANDRDGKTVSPGITGTPAPSVSAPAVLPPSVSSPSVTPSSIAPSTSTSPPGTSNSAPNQASTQTSSTPSSQSTPAPCRAADLAVTSSPWTGRTGHLIGIFLFHNTGSATCRVSGYPQVTGVNKQGVTTTTATHTLTGWAGTLSSVPTVDIPPGGYASAGVEWRNGTDDGSQCALVATFEVTPPSGGTPTKIPAGEPSLTDGPACSKFEIHPLVAGFDASYFYPPYNPPVTSSK